MGPEFPFIKRPAAPVRLSIQEIILVACYPILPTQLNEIEIFQLEIHVGAIGAARHEALAGNWSFCESRQLGWNPGQGGRRRHRDDRLFLRRCVRNREKCLGGLDVRAGEESPTDAAYSRSRVDGLRVREMTRGRCRLVVIWKPWPRRRGCGTHAAMMEVVASGE